MTQPQSNVLIVEDEFLVALEIEAQMKDMGFNVIGPATNLRDAVKLATERDDIAVAVLDINLTGEHSWPVARELKTRDVPFFFLTGYLRGHVELPADLKEAEICYKPLDPLQLRSVIAKVTRSS
jgi:DNA-binding response OmpR family regulator